MNFINSDQLHIFLIFISYFLQLCESCKQSYKFFLFELLQIKYFFITKEI